MESWSGAKEKGGQNKAAFLRFGVM